MGYPHIWKWSKLYPKTYNVWKDMRYRCLNPKNPRYSRYGGRGITLCERWLSFDNFVMDMGPRPEGRSLGRIDNNLGYFHENCRWETKKQQERNKVTSVLITWQGKTQCMADWAEETSLKYHVIKDRHSKGWKPSEIFQPLLRKRKTS